MPYPPRRRGLHQHGGRTGAARAEWDTRALFTKQRPDISLPPTMITVASLGESIGGFAASQGDSHVREMIQAI